jgi:hypothetical protein
MHLPLIFASLLNSIKYVFKCVFVASDGVDKFVTVFAKGRKVQRILIVHTLD